MDTIAVDFDALRRLNNELCPPRQPGEFTILEFAQAQDPPMTRGRARVIIERGIHEGTLTRRVYDANYLYKRVG
jgi:hypothetical protein